MEHMVMDEQGKPGWWRPHQEKDAYWDRVRKAEEEAGTRKPSGKEGIVGWEPLAEGQAEPSLAEKEATKNKN